ncbi:MAG TPA: ABC transporter permease [Anaeromyxobacteraceae bacterium]|nr:ABC transporter permease [Anaeromyxobacteraceae bacterium]
MLRHVFPDPLALGLAQAALVSLAALAVALLARRRRIHVVQSVAVALARGLVQICAIGSVLLAMLHGPRWLAGIALVGMVGAAAITAARRARAVPGALRIAALAILSGAGSVLVLTVLAGAVDPTVTSLVPVGSMLIASAMNAVGLALERFRSDVVAHASHVESALALGASPEAAAEPYVRAAFQASLLPAIDNLRSLGIVWIPGLMTGMVLTGTPPVQAAVYQFVVIAMIFSSSALTCLVATSLVRAGAFSPAEQLLLRGDAHP